MVIDKLNPGLRKTLWFVALWIVGVAVLGVIAYGIRLGLGL